MLKYLKQDWPSLVIYLAAGQVLLSADVNSLGWQFWAIYGLFVLHGYWIRSSEFSAHYETHIANCERCERTLQVGKQIKQEDIDKYIERLNESIKRQPDRPLKPPFSAPSTPADTNQHDAKPPSL